MLKVGLTGGYATGKSFVAQELTRLGCHVIYADKLGHQVLLPDGQAYRPVLERFGPEILDGGGAIDRKKLGAVVFRDPAALHELSALVHPAVYELQDAFFAEISQRGPAAVAVVEAAILIETGRLDVYDRLMVTTCSPELQIERGMQRDHLSRAEVMTRLERQMPAREKAAYADYLIDTGLPKVATIRQIETAFEDMKHRAEAKP